MYTYHLRVRTTFPGDRVGDGDKLPALRMIATEGWMDEDDVLVNDQSMEALLWANLEIHLGRRQDFPGSPRRYRMVAYDTQEVCQEVACHQHFAEQGRQWLESRIIDLQRGVQIAFRSILRRPITAHAGRRTWNEACRCRRVYVAALVVCNGMRGSW